MLSQASFGGARKRDGLTIKPIRLIEDQARPSTTHPLVIPRAHARWRQGHPQTSPCTAASRASTSVHRERASRQHDQSRSSFDTRGQWGPPHFHSQLEMLGIHAQALRCCGAALLHGSGTPPRRCHQRSRRSLWSPAPRRLPPPQQPGPQYSPMRRTNPNLCSRPARCSSRHVPSGSEPSHGRNG